MSVLTVPVSDQFAYVDEADYQSVVVYSWYLTGKEDQRYAYTFVYGRQQISMHRLIMGFPTLFVDHRDGNGLNNVRSNLRLSTPSQNLANSRKRRGSYTSQYKGVNWG